MPTEEKAERETISAKLKRRIEELDKIIRELEKRKKGEEKSNNKLTYGLAILTILTSLACGLMIKFFLFI